MKLIGKLKNKYLIGAVLFIIALIPSIFFYTRYRNAQKLLQNPQALTNKQTKELILEIGKLINLPREDATVATVTDKERLKDQPFFKDAENGDRVLIYSKSRKAILYRPSIHKIIEVSSLAIGTSSGQVVQSPTPSIFPFK